MGINVCLVRHRYTHDPSGCICLVLLVKETFPKNIRYIPFTRILVPRKLLEKTKILECSMMLTQ